MPHVVTQMQPREKPQQSYTPKRTMMKTSISHDNLRPHIAPRRQNANGVTPTLSLLVTPHDAWNYTSGRQQVNHFSPDKFTPVSAVDSVFELSSAITTGSPNSAISSFVAELEDTSPGAVKPQRFNVDPKSPLSPTLSLHATTAIDAINDFEAENKRLLERALAAETAAKILKEQNIDLRRKVKYCMEQHRPKTAPSQSQRTSQHPHKRNTGYTTTTPLSAFNTMMDQVEAERIPTPTNTTPTPLPRHKSSIPSQSPVSNRSEITPNRFGPNGFIPSRRPPPIPEGMNGLSSNSNFQTHRSHHTMMRRNGGNSVGTTRSNSQMTKISLADAKLRSKPLPPLGPMAQSVIPGVVEIGSAHDDTSPKSQSQLKSKKSIVGFFRRGRKD